MEKVKDIDMKKMQEELTKVKEEMKELRPKLENEMQKAKVELEKAKAEMKEYKAFVDGLDSDGLINKKEAYTLKHKDGELLINGKKATEQVYNKYRSFLEKHKKFNIEKSNDDFDINVD
jgi:TATA-box binding protein (TBP) (component of TFIID and TFIIIB)